MTALLRRDSLGRKLVRAGWRFAQTASVFASSITSGGRGPVRLFYGGARSGDLGGPLVKVKRLSEYFPESRWRYTLVYLLSNTPYLSAGALDWLRRRRIPIVLNQNGVFYSSWYAGDWRGQNAGMAKAYHLADHVFWQSEFCRRSADKFLGQRSGNGEVLLNAVDTDHFSPARRPADRPLTFLVTGKLGAHLGYRLASTIQGFALACRLGLNARLNIAGWIEDVAGAHAMISRYCDADKVRILGPYTQETAPKIYRGADVYVMTKYLDPCPNTVIEAMACGLPILYSASGGVPELAGDEAGIGLPVPEDWEEIHVPTAEAIAEGMLSIVDLRHSMGQAARARAEAKFNIRNWIERHRVIFNKLLQSMK